MEAKDVNSGSDAGVVHIQGCHLTLIEKKKRKYLFLIWMEGSFFFFLPSRMCCCES